MSVNMRDYRKLTVSTTVTVTVVSWADLNNLGFGRHINPCIPRVYGFHELGSGKKYKT